LNERKAFLLKPLHRNLSKGEDNEKKSLEKEGEKKIGKGCCRNNEAQAAELGGGQSASPPMSMPTLNILVEASGTASLQHPNS
jgi:hypothetical protein